MTCRLFLGGCEGGLFPGMILYLSGFYRRAELQIRIALFFTSVSLSGAFSGLLAAALQQLSGRGGMSSWQWIFLLEGLFTLCFGIFAFFMMPNGPRQVKTFKPEHTEHCIRRLNEDSNNFEKDKVTAKAVLSVFKDVHVLISLPFYLATGSLGAGLAVFGPSIVAALGYSSTITQLLTVPPYVMAFIVTLMFAWFSDRYHQRGLAAFGGGIIALIGFIMLLTTKSFGARYTGICLSVTGSYSNAPSLLTWLPNNTAGYARRATAIASLAIMTSCGAIISTWIYPAASAPYYHFGAKFNIGIICGMEVLIVALIFWLKRQNQIKEEHPEVLIRGLEHLSEDEQFAILGDHHPRYKYSY